MTNNPKAAAAAAGARAPASEAASPRRRQRVAVIGAGASGLTAVKACLEEGLDVVCYERTDVLAGLWHYTDTVERGRACVMRSTVINSSKEMSAFSDFPPDDTLPNYMHNSHMARYIVDYGRRCGAVDRVLLRHEVADVRPTRPGSEDTTWTLRVRRLDSEGGGDREEFEDERDAVMVCTGHHAHPLWPRFKGLGDERGEGRVFAGRVMHSQDYRTSRGFEDRRVLVIGVGNSAGDLAVELGGVAEQVWLSTSSRLVGHRPRGTQGSAIRRVLPDAAAECLHPPAALRADLPHLRERHQPAFRPRHLSAEAQAPHPRPASNGQRRPAQPHTVRHRVHQRTSEGVHGGRRALRGRPTGRRASSRGRRDPRDRLPRLVPVPGARRARRVRGQPGRRVPAGVSPGAAGTRADRTGAAHRCLAAHIRAAEPLGGQGVRRQRDAAQREGHVAAGERVPGALQATLLPGAPTHAAGRLDRLPGRVGRRDRRQTEPGTARHQGPAARLPVAGRTQPVVPVSSARAPRLARGAGRHLGLRTARAQSALHGTRLYRHE
ncbi:uncharacterized protein LOC119460837 isoform X2 [Dermacentor silvarum]|nr:uncharacterized protein LOC119460837 isoform X2 [Dermacentor silvarum]